MNLNLPNTGPGGVPIEYLTRCAALRHRGLSREVMHMLQDAQDEPLLVELEQASDEALRLVSELEEQQRTDATMEGTG